MSRDRPGKYTRVPLTVTTSKGWFGLQARGWPYEGMFDEGPTSSAVGGQDSYRLNEGPQDPSKKFHPEDPKTLDGFQTINLRHTLLDECAGDTADAWIKETLGRNEK